MPKAAAIVHLPRILDNADNYLEPHLLRHGSPVQARLHPLYTAEREIAGIRTPALKYEETRDCNGGCRFWQVS